MANAAKVKAEGGVGRFEDDAVVAAHRAQPRDVASSAGGVAIDDRQRIAEANDARGQHGLSATILLALLEECNPDASNIVASYDD